MDVRVIKAIEEAVAEAGESPSLSTKLIALLDALSSGQTQLNDRESADRHIDLLYDNVADRTAMDE